MIEIKAIAKIRKNETGEIRDHDITIMWEGEDGEDGRWNTWIWEEGNFSCDCNRASFFGDDDEIQCSDGRYSVNIVDPETGEVLYREYSEV
jgi:hypothetical protein